MPPPGGALPTPFLRHSIKRVWRGTQSAASDAGRASLAEIEMRRGVGSDVSVLEVQGTLLPAQHTPDQAQPPRTTLALLQSMRRSSTRGAASGMSAGGCKGVRDQGRGERAPRTSHAPRTASCPPSAPCSPLACPEPTPAIALARSLQTLLPPQTTSAALSTHRTESEQQREPHAGTRKTQTHRG